MSKVIRIAIAAAFGVVTTVPAIAGFESYGPGTKQNQELNSLQDVNPPSFDSDPRNALADARNSRYFRSDRPVVSDSPMSAERRDYYTADGRYVGSDLRYYTPDGRYIGPDGRLDQFGYPPVLAQNHSRLNGGIWPGQTLE